MTNYICIGDTVICAISGVVGQVIAKYYPTACEQQTMVITNDGRKYHAPTSTWIIVKNHGGRAVGEGSLTDEMGTLTEDARKWAAIEAISAMSAPCDDKLLELIERNGVLNLQQITATLAEAFLEELKEKEDIP